MTLNPNDYRLLQGLEDGKPQTLEMLQRNACRDQTLDQVLQAAGRLQRHSPALIKRLPCFPTPENRNTQPHWLLTLDGYLTLMEFIQTAERDARNGRRIVTATGQTHYYRIARTEKPCNWNQYITIYTRVSLADSWTLTATGLTVRAALSKAKQILNKGTEATFP